MNLNNKKNLFNKHYQNKSYENFYFKWSNIDQSKLNDIKFLNSDLSESNYKNIKTLNVSLEKVLCWNSIFHKCDFKNINTKKFDSRDNEFNEDFYQ